MDLSVTTSRTRCLDPSRQVEAGGDRR